LPQLLLDIQMVSRARQANEFVSDFHGFVEMISASLRARHSLRFGTASAKHAGDQMATVFCDLTTVIASVTQSF